MLGEPLLQHQISVPEQFEGVRCAIHHNKELKWRQKEEILKSRCGLER
jgi:hypothetical protein